MESQNPQERFEHAAALYKEKRFAEALVLFEQLETLMPDSPDLLYPQAMCLAALRRADEATAIRRRLRGRYDQAKLDKLKRRIEEKRALDQEPAGVSATAPPPLPSIDDDPFPLPPLPSLPPIPTPTGNTPTPGRSGARTPRQPSDRLPRQKPVPQPGSRSPSPVVFLVILAIGGLGAGGWWYLNRGKSEVSDSVSEFAAESSSESSPETSSPAPSSPGGSPQFVKYDGPKFGLAFEHPSSWIIKEYGGSPLVPDLVLLSKPGEPERFLPEADVSIKNSGTVGGESQTTVESRTSYDYDGIAVTVRNMDLGRLPPGGSSLLEYLSIDGFVEKRRAMLKEGAVTTAPSLGVIGGREAASCELTGKTAAGGDLLQRLILVHTDGGFPALLSFYYVAPRTAENRAIEALIVKSISARPRAPKEIAAVEPTQIPAESPVATPVPATTEPPATPAPTPSGPTLADADAKLDEATKFWQQGDDRRAVESAKSAHAIKLAILGADHADVKAIEEMISTAQKVSASPTPAASAEVIPEGPSPLPAAPKSLAELTAPMIQLGQSSFELKLRTELEAGSLRESVETKSYVTFEPQPGTRPRFAFKFGAAASPSSRLVSDGLDFIAYSPERNEFLLARSSEGANVYSFIGQVTPFLRGESALLLAASMFLPINPDSPSSFETIQFMGNEAVRGRPSKRYTLTGRGEQADMWFLDGPKPYLQRIEYAGTRFFVGSQNPAAEQLFADRLAHFFGGDPARFVDAIAKVRTASPPQGVKLILSFEFDAWMAPVNTPSDQYQVTPPPSAQPFSPEEATAP